MSDCPYCGSFYTWVSASPVSGAFTLYRCRNCRSRFRVVWAAMTCHDGCDPGDCQCSVGRKDRR